MDTDTLLNTIFDEYKTKCLKEMRDEELEKIKFETLKKQIVDKMSILADDYIGQPNNEATAIRIRDDLINRMNNILDIKVSNEDDSILIDATVK